MNVPPSGSICLQRPDDEGEDLLDEEERDDAADDACDDRGRIRRLRSSSRCSRNDIRPLSSSDSRIGQFDAMSSSSSAWPGDGARERHERHQALRPGRSAGAGPRRRRASGDAGCSGGRCRSVDRCVLDADLFVQGVLELVRGPFEFLRLGPATGRAQGASAARR